MENGNCRQPIVELVNGALWRLRRRRCTRQNATARYLIRACAAGERRKQTRLRSAVCPDEKENAPKKVGNVMDQGEHASELQV
jgi:hypothetical protein